MTVLISKYLLNAGYSPHYVILPTKGNGSDISSFIPGDVLVTRLDNSTRFKLLKHIYRTIKTSRPACCFSSVINLNDKLLLFRRFFPKTSFIIRCDNYLFSYNWLQKILIRLIYKQADAIIAQTEEMADELIAGKCISKRKVIVLHNPLDTSTINSKLDAGGCPYPLDGKYHIVAIGRFAFQKGYDILIRALSLLVDRDLPVDLYIVGSKIGLNESEYDRVMRIVQNNHLDQNVHCVGFQDNPYIYMKHADCFVLSSRWEGLPNALIEALYLGTPVAAVKCIPIISRLVNDGENGFLAECENEESLAVAIQKALQMGRVSSGYNPSKPDDFVELFERIIG